MALRQITECCGKNLHESQVHLLCRHGCLLCAHSFFTSAKWNHGNNIAINGKDAHLNNITQIERWLKSSSGFESIDRTYIIFQYLRTYCICTPSTVSENDSSILYPQRFLWYPQMGCVCECSGVWDNMVRRALETWKSLLPKETKNKIVSFRTDTLTLSYGMLLIWYSIYAKWNRGQLHLRIS